MLTLLGRYFGEPLATLQVKVGGRDCLLSDVDAVSVETFSWFLNSSSRLSRVYTSFLATCRAPAGTGANLELVAFAFCMASRRVRSLRYEPPLLEAACDAAPASCPPLLLSVSELGPAASSSSWAAISASLQGRSACLCSRWPLPVPLQLLARAQRFSGSPTAPSARRCLTSSTPTPSASPSTSTDRSPTCLSPSRSLAPPGIPGSARTRERAGEEQRWAHVSPPLA